MNQKVLSLLFSALLASTFVHEIRAKAAANPAFANQIQERIADPILNCNACNDKATGSGNITIEISANAEANLLAFTNATAQVAFIVDVNANISVLLNGDTGAAIVINLAKNEVVYIDSGVWEAENTSFEDYLASLTSGLTDLLGEAGAIVYKVASVPDKVLKEVNAILVCLIINITSELEVDVKIGLQLIIQIAIAKVTVLSGALKGFTAFIGSQVVKIKSDLAAILNICQAFGDVVSQIPDGLEGLKNAEIDIDIQVYASLTSGLDRLIYIIKAIGTKLDIGAILGSKLNDVEELFKLIAKLGGNENTGITGLFKVLAKIVGFIQGKVTIEVVINVVIQFLAYTAQTVEQDLSALLNEALSDLLEAVEDAGVKEKLSKLVETVDALIKGTLEIGGVKISAILKILVTKVYKGVKLLLQVLVLVVLELKAILDFKVAVLYCLLVLIVNVSSTIGVELLKSLGIAIDGISGATGNLITAVLKSVKNLLNILKGDFYNFLVGLPIIGKIVEALNAAVKEATNGEYDLKSLLNASTLIKNLIKGLFQLLSGISLLVNSTIIAQIKLILKHSTSLNFYLGIDVNVCLVGIGIYVQ